MNRVLINLVAIMFGIMPAVAQQELLQSQQTSTQQRLVETKSVSSAVSKVSSESPDRPAQNLGSVKKIFVDNLGTGRGSELIRQKIINKLMESGHIVVVDSSDEADATFNGVARLHRYGLYDDLVTSGEAVVRLVGKSKQILWTDDVAINKFPNYSNASKMSSRIADKLVKDLTEAIELDKNK